MELTRAGLKVEQETKLNPRLLVRGVPCELSAGDIEAEIIALNLKNQVKPTVKVVYIFPTKDNRRTTNCVIEVSPDIRSLLLREKHIYINYSACSLSDHVRVLQCFKCLAFGHFAGDCKSPALCGYCAGNHESKDFSKREVPSICGNCRR